VKDKDDNDPFEDAWEEDKEPKITKVMNISKV
jgi:hypothetical protein